MAPRRTYWVIWPTWEISDSLEKMSKSFSSPGATLRMVRMWPMAASMVRL